MNELTIEEKAARVLEDFAGDRYFIRCQHCLSVACIDRKPERNWVCALCRGPIELMGKVEWDRLLEKVEVSVCDARCTNARGPLCACPCHGKNHGTGRMVTLTIDRGPEPEVNMPASEVALAVAKAFLEARVQVLALSTELRRQRTRGFLSHTDFSRMRRAEWAVRKANAGRVHASRMKALTAALAPVAVAA